ncbi:hypothetical protein FKV23_15650 [Lysobacter alkalisoli]|uniref:Type IV secretory system conjugative DNA transfer family protein n=1 Tax=Marilutibacter alkalisoli TaxID=2591633 RepID=A0A514BVE7_9GAMM|nr:hypothetical protein FKV23_15650 [Lysobacter alkalisoli]
MTKPKLLTALALLVLALVAGLYFSGWLALMFMKLDTATLGFGTYWNYLQLLDHPRMQPYTGRVKFAGAIGFGLPMLVWIASLVLLLRTGQDRDIHGKARFAGLVDLAQKGFLKSASNGIVVGKKNGKLLRLPGQQFVVLAAPTRSGKGVGVVIPNLLEYDESVVVLDIKQENFDLTSGWRASRGQEIYLFNPFADDRRTHRWNPLTYVSKDPAFRVSDLMSIAAMLYPDGDDKDKFWVSQARNAFMAFGLYLFEKADHEGTGTPTLGGVYRLSSDTGGEELKPYLQTLSQAPFLSANARTAFAGLLSQADVTFASIIGSFKEPLNAWINPVLDAATSADDFRLDDVRKRKMTIYIGIQPNKLAESRLIVNLFFSQLINVNTKELPQNNPELKHQCLLLMDEFTALGRVDIIAKAVAYMAGYNLRLLPIIQSMAQLDAVYGREMSRTIITNHALQIIYAPREQQDANDYSEMLGYTTVHRKQRTRSRGQGNSTSYSEAYEKRALMLPQELKAMGPDKEIFLYEGLAHPVMCEKIRYYKDRYFTKRLLPKVEVAPLNLPGTTSLPGKSASVIAASTLAMLAACASPHSAAQDEAAATVIEPRQDHAPAEFRCPPVTIPAERMKEIEAERAFYERMVDSMIEDGDLPVEPGYKWEGHSDRPIEFLLGPHRFWMPHNIMQSRPGSRPLDDVRISFQWPCMEPLPPGVDYADHPEHFLRSISPVIAYRDPERFSLRDRMQSFVEPIDPDNPKHRSDPMENLDLRIQGEPVYGLESFYADLEKVEAFLTETYSERPSRENLIRNSKEWYLRMGDTGYPMTVLKCDSREEPDGLLIDGNQVVNDPANRRRAMCDHFFAIPEWNLHTRITYPRVFMRDWKRIESRVRDLLHQGHMQ